MNEWIEREVIVKDDIVFHIWMMDKMMMLSTVIKKGSGGGKKEGGRGEA